MSQENVELVRRAYEAWNKGGPEAAKQFWAKDIEFHDPPTLPDPRVVRGRVAVAAYLMEQANVVGDMKLTPVDVRVLDELRTWCACASDVSPRAAAAESGGRPRG